MRIRLASEAEALAIVSEPGTVARIGKQPEQMTVQPWIAEEDGRRLLFVFWQVGEPMVFEVHVAAPRRDLSAARHLAAGVIEWLFQQGVHRLVTACPHGSISNFARKLGMVENGRDDTTIYFEVTPWEWEQPSPAAP